MWEELHRDGDDRPSLMELAKVWMGVRTDLQFREAAAAARWLARRRPETRNLHDELERLRRESGPVRRPDDWAAVLEYHAQIDWLAGLLACGQDWSDPDDVLDRTRSMGDIDLQALLNVCGARLTRAQGHEKETLEGVQRRLGACCDRERIGS